ncbi:uncharacterized protein LOC124164362 [Ischnura elegans]|uniref:uncharacterized protein LOC124164362 n=1 Tax=Ischnura elegans TaxID=197161 RepID=UPI001ED8724E|nr:uncharacterized protein LOC124164362 [Ischnura elegans]
MFPGSLMRKVLLLLLVLNAAALLAKAQEDEDNSEFLGEEEIDTGDDVIGEEDEEDEDDEMEEGGGFDCDPDMMGFELVTGSMFRGGGEGEGLGPGGRGLARGRQMAVLVEMLVLGECIEACAANSSCRSLNYETGLCVLFDTDADEHPDSLMQSDYPVFTVYAQKMCLEERLPCERAWVSERVLGYEMVGSKAKGRPAVKVSSRQECMALCLQRQNEEGQVPCRSANYNNQTGDCVLFEMDRTTLGGDIRTSFKKAKEPGSEYMENACVDEPSRLCQFRSLPGVLLKTADSVLRDVGSPDECRELCLSSVSSGATAPFRCRSYDWGSAGEKVCRLSHLSAATATHFPSAYIPVPEASTWELSACYNVSVECGARGMVARVMTDRLFGGKIYARGNPKSCAADVTAVMRFALELPYDDVECGVRRGEVRMSEGKGVSRDGRVAMSKAPAPRRRIGRSTGEGGVVGKYTTDIVIQHHDFIVTSADLGLSVTCQYDLTNKTVSNEVDLRVRGGVIDPNDPHVPVLTEEVVVSSPDVAMRIVKRGEEEWSTGENEVGTAAAAKVGDPLSLRFEIPEDSPFEIFVQHLVAMDGGDSAQIVLIDEMGCPTDQFIMGALRKSANSPKVLIADFDAFKFPTSEVVQFRALVTPCMPSCEPVRCSRLAESETVGQSEDELRNGPFIESYGKRRRRRREVEDDDDKGVDVESAEKYAVEEAQLAFQNVFEEEVEEAMQDGLTEAFHLAVHSLFGKRRRRSTDKETTAIEPEIHQEKNLLLVQSIRISDRFGPERRESVEDGQDDLAASCMDTKGLAFGSAAFLLAQVALMVAWVFLRRGRGGKKDEEKMSPVQMAPPREVLYHNEAPWVGKRQRF